VVVCSSVLIVCDSSCADAPVLAVSSQAKHSKRTLQDAIPKARRERVRDIDVMSRSPLSSPVIRTSARTAMLQLEQRCSAS
jgi:hypothetical protein